MDALKIAAIALVVAGMLGLTYGGFTYTTRTHEAMMGPFSLSMNERHTMNVPVWAGIGAIVLGGGLLLARRRP